MTDNRPGTELPNDVQDTINNFIKKNPKLTDVDFHTFCASIHVTPEQAIEVVKKKAPKFKLIATIKLREQIREVIKTAINEERDFISPTVLADELVKAGVINSDYTDLSGKKASSKLGFIIDKILSDIRK